MTMLDLRPDPPDETDALPHSVEAEQAVLGLVLFQNEAFHSAPGLKPEHFSEPFHGRLWAEMAAMIAKGRLAEPIALMERFQGDAAFDDLGGVRYLADLVDRAPMVSSAGHYAELIIESSQRRELIGLATEVAKSARTQAVTPSEIVEGIEQGLAALVEGEERGGGFQTFDVAVDAAIEMAAAAYAKDGEVTGVATGLIDLDRKLGGMHPSDVLIVAGRPSMGKTALATTVAFNVASKYAGQEQPDGTMKTVSGGRVGFFSLEMSKEQLALRLLADAAGIASDRIRRGDIEAHEFGRLRDAAELIRRIPLHIDETGAISIAKLAARARRLKRQKGLDLIVVDYLQLCTGSDRSRGGNSNRVQEVTEITSGLKALAKELGVPILALSQLSRKVEERDDKRPQLSDLRESGSIEQDADVVMFVYREEYYLARAEPKTGTAQHESWQTEMMDAAHKAEVIIGKQRHGPIGTVRLAFSGDTTRFGNLARESRYDYSTARMPYGSDE